MINEKWLRKAQQNIHLTNTILEIPHEKHSQH